MMTHHPLIGWFPGSRGRWSIGSMCTILCVFLLAGSPLVVIVQGSDVTASGDLGSDVGPGQGRGRGSTWYVDDDAVGGNGSLERPFTRIQQALSEADDGDIIRVFAGSYNDTFDITHSISMIGNGSANTTITHDDMGDIVTISANYVLFQGFSVKGVMRGGMDAAIRVYSDSCMILDNDCSGKDYQIFLLETQLNTVSGNNCSGNYGRGIYIKDSNNSYVHNNTFSWNDLAGVYLYKSWDNTIENNTCLFNKDGIVLDKGYTNDVKFNNCSGNQDSGIEIWGTNNNDVHDNECLWNENYGIYLRKNSETNDVNNNTCLHNIHHGIYSEDCDSNYLYDNTLEHNLIDGLYLFRSNDNSLQRNHLQGNTRYGIHIDTSADIFMTENLLIDNPFYIDDDERGMMGTHIIDETNLVNNRSILYLANTEGTILPEGGGQVILVGCTNITVKDQNCSDGAVGIHIVDCSGIIVENSTCSNNSIEGIRLLSSEYCDIINTTASDNRMSGFTIQFCTYSTIIHIRALANAFNGIDLQDSYFNNFSSNNISYNGQTGISVSDSGRNDFMNNSCQYNGQYGMIFRDCDEITIVNSTCTNSEKNGILLDRCMRFILDSNRCSGVLDADVMIRYSEFINLTRNSLLSRGLFIANHVLEEWTTYEIDDSNTVRGKPLRFYKNAEDILVPEGAGQVIVVNSTGVVIRDQELNGTVAGIQLVFSREITIRDCQCSNGIYGVYVYDSQELLIRNNTSDENLVTGILFFLNSDDNQLVNNSCCSNGENGIEQRGTFNKQNIISGNKCTNNDVNGMALYGGYQYEINDNNCSFNGYNGIRIGDDQNIFTDNSLVGNLRCGLELQGSNNNEIFRNMINDNTIAGISLSSSDDNNMVFNSIQQNGYGITMEYSSRDNLAHFNLIENNSNLGIDALESFYPIDATKNWWGHKSGPYHAQNNPEGKGNGISDGVDFDPWLVNPKGDQSIRTWYVDDDGSPAGTGTLSDPFRTIQEALDSAADGERVLMFNGTYHGKLQVNNSVILEGNSSADTHIIGEGTGDAVQINADYVSLRDFSITGSGSMDLDAGIHVRGNDVHIESLLVFSNRYGILLDGVENNSVRECICRENMDGIHGRNVHNSLIIDNQCSKNGFYGVSFISSTGNEVKQNTCNDNGNTGISLSNSNDNTVSDNECDGNHFSGIYAGTSSFNILSDNNCGNNSFYGIYVYSTSQENVIENSNCTGNEDGIRIFGSMNNTLNRNICTDGKRGIYIYASDGNMINDNECDENNFAGIYIFESDDNHIAGGSCSMTMGDGIYAIHSNDLSIINVTISDNPLSGVYLMNSTGLDLSNSTISGNDVGVYAGEGSAGVEVHHNRLILNSELAVDASDNQNISINATWNWWGNITGPYHVDENPEGTGDRVTDHVLFDPWMMKPTADPYLYVDANATEPGDGTPEKPLWTIYDALIRAEPGNIVIVEEGRYNENISIDIPLWITGSPYSDIIIDAGGSDHGVRINSDHVLISGITITNATSSVIYILESINVTISNCTLLDANNSLVIDNSTVILQNTWYMYATTQLLGQDSQLFVYNSADIRVINSRSGYIPGAEINISYDQQQIFNGMTNSTGKVIPLLLEVYKNASSIFIPGHHDLEIRKDGYLNYSRGFTLLNGIDLVCELEDHAFPVSRISGEEVRYANMDSELILNGSGSTGMNITWRWDLGDGWIEYGPMILHTYRVPGIYTVNLTVKDHLGKEDCKEIMIIVENVLPTAFAWPDTVSPYEDVMVTFDASLCEDTVSDEIIISWNFGDGSTAVGIVVTHNYTHKGSYQVVYSVVDLFGGTAGGSFTISVINRVPWEVSIETATDGLQYHQHVFTGSAIDTVSDKDSLIFSWNFGDRALGIGRSVTHIYQKPGNYIITLSVMDDDGEAMGYMTTVQIGEFDIDIDVTVGPSGFVRNSVVFFTAMAGLSPLEYDYMWYFGDGHHDPGYTTQHRYDIPGEYLPYVVIITEHGNITQYLNPIIVQNIWHDPYITVHGSETIMEDEEILFSGFSLNFADNFTIAFIWDFGDGTGAVGELQEHSYSESGEYIVRLEISDGITSSSAGTIISVLNSPPEADAGIPVEQHVTPGEMILLDGSSSTDSQSDVGTLNYTWYIGSTIQYGKISSYRFTEEGDYPVRLVVTDDDGLTSEVTITFHVIPENEEKDGDSLSQLSVFLAASICFIILYLALVMKKYGNNDVTSGRKQGTSSSGSAGKKMDSDKETKDHHDMRGNDPEDVDGNGLDEWKRKSDDELS